MGVSLGLTIVDYDIVIVRIVEKPRLGQVGRCMYDRERLTHGPPLPRAHFP